MVSLDEFCPCYAALKRTVWRFCAPWWLGALRTWQRRPSRSVSAQCRTTRAPRASARHSTPSLNSTPKSPMKRSKVSIAPNSSAANVIVREHFNSTTCASQAYCHVFIAYDVHDFIELQWQHCNDFVLVSKMMFSNINIFFYNKLAVVLSGALVT